MEAENQGGGGCSERLDEPVKMVSPEDIVIDKANDDVVIAAWDNNEFMSMMQTDLLTYSFALSVAPMTKVMETMGLTLHKHDESLLELLRRCREVEKQQQNQNEAKAIEQVKDGLLGAIENARADLLAMIHSLEANNDALDKALRETNEQLNSRPTIETIESPQPVKDTDELRILSERLDKLEKNLTDLATQPKDAPTEAPMNRNVDDDQWKEQLMQSVQAQLNAMQAFMQSEFDGERQRVQGILDGHTKDASPASPHALISQLRRAQSHPSGLRDDAPDLSAANTQSIDLTPVHERLDRDEELLEALRQQNEALQEGLDLIQAETKALRELSLSNAAVPETIVEDKPAPAIIPIIPNDQPDNCALERELSRHKIVMDTLSQDIRELQTQQSGRNKEVDGKVQDIDKRMRSLETAEVVHTSLLDTQKASIQKVKADLSKFASELQSIVDNQSLMQGFAATSNGNNDAPDLSLVFSKLNEIRRDQQKANEELQANVDAVGESSRESLQRLHAFQIEINNLTNKINHHQLAIGTHEDRDAAVAKKRNRQLDTQIAMQKDVVQRGLHVQERIQPQLLDIKQSASELRREIDMNGNADQLNVKVQDVQKLYQIFHHVTPQISQVLMIPPHSHEAIQRISQAIEASHGLPQEEISSLMEGIAHVQQLLSSLEIHNVEVSKQNEQIRAQLDELWNAWNSKMHIDMLSKYTLFSKELRELVAKQQIHRVQSGLPPSQPSSHQLKFSTENGPIDTKTLETKLVSTARRLNEIEDNLRAVSKNLMSFKQDMNDKVTAGNLSKLKFQIFSELAKIHAFLGSARFQGQAVGGQPQKVFQDADLKASLDAQAEHISTLCNNLKHSIAENSNGDSHSLTKLSNDNQTFNSKLEEITEKVAELFLSLELNRSSTQPRHVIPTYNPAQMLDSFAQTLEGKLAETQSLNRRQIDGIKDELNDIVRQRVAKALEGIHGTFSSGDETTAAGSKPVVCIACSRPVKIETHIQDTIHDRMHAESMIKVPHDSILDIPIDEPGDEYHVYRAGFRMPGNDKRNNLGKNLLPLLNNMSPVQSPTKRSRKKLATPQASE